MVNRGYKIRQYREFLSTRHHNGLGSGEAEVLCSVDRKCLEKVDGL